ncbi:rhomboid family intramembrane serine protease [filamentous cyanobacterium CCP5]|nr:rhomboid family intramembrane serine protease [filamentous cyanobacterium CCP5]
MAADDSQLRARLERLEAELNSGSTPASVPASSQESTPTQPASPGVLTRLRQNIFLPLQILAVIWAQEIIDQVVFGGRWNLPVHPRSLDGLLGIFTSAFSHSGFPHLIGNSIAFATFSWLVLLKSRRDFWITLLIGWLGGGAASWLLGPNSAHGLSGVVYTLFGYLLVIGWLEKRFVPLLISVFVLINYSAFIWGVLPTQPMVAWWGHLFGLVLGVVAAYSLRQKREEPS